MPPSWLPTLQLYNHNFEISHDQHRWRPFFAASAHGARKLSGTSCQTVHGSCGGATLTTANLQAIYISFKENGHVLLNKSSLVKNWILKMSLVGDLGRPRPLNVDLVSCLSSLIVSTFSRKLSQATTSSGLMMRRIQSLSHLGVYLLSWNMFCQIYRHHLDVV